MLAHHDAEQAAVPHLGRAVSAVFQFIVQFLTLITAFRRCPCIVFQLPFFAASGRVIEKPRVVGHDKVYCPAVFRIGTWGLTGAGRFPACEADPGALKFCPALCGFGTVPAHDMPLRTYRHTVIVDGKVIFIYGRTAPADIQVDKRDNAVAEAVFIVRHGVMGRVQEKLCYLRLRKELLHGIPVIKEPDGIMPGSRAEDRENGQVIFRIGGGKHVQIIAKIPALPVGIPSDVTVRLAVDTVAFTIPYSFFKTVTGTFFTFLCSSVNRGAIPGNGKVEEVKEAILMGFQEEKVFEQLEKEKARLHVLWRCLFKLFEDVLDGKLFDRRCFLPFFVRFPGFFLWRMFFWRQINIIGKPKAVLEIVKGACSGSVTNSKAGKDGMEMVFLEVSSPFRIGSDFKLHREENGTEHVGREPWSGSKIRITVLQEGINL